LLNSIHVSSKTFSCDDATGIALSALMMPQGQTPHCHIAFG